MKAKLAKMEASMNTFDEFNPITCDPWVSSAPDCPQNFMAAGQTCEEGLWSESGLDPTS